MYKNIRIQFERCSCLDNKTTRHSPPKMQNTFKSLGKYMQKERAHHFTVKRSPRYSVPDIRAKKTMRTGRKDEHGDSFEMEIGDDG